MGLGRTPDGVLASSPRLTCIDLQPIALGLVVVPVEIASGSRRGSYPFLLDTGSEATFVDDELAKMLALPNTSRTEVVTAAGAAPAVASRVTLAYGSVEAPDVELVRDRLTSLRSLAPAIRGVLGQDVLRRTNWLLDYRQGRVIQDPDGVFGERLRGDRLPVRWAGELPTVDASFGRSTPVRLVLDSAATGLVLFRLPIGTPSGASARLTTFSGERRAPMVTADTLRVGPIALPHPNAAILPPPGHAGETGGLLPTSLFDAVYFDQTRDTATVITYEATETQSHGGRHGDSCERDSTRRREAAASGRETGNANHLSDTGVRVSRLVP